MATLIETCEAGHDHDTTPVTFPCEITGHDIDLGHYSRMRPLAATGANVLG
jgi:sarcosine oxidase subunit beta